MTESILTTPPDPAFNSKYPPPPRVHWVMLVAVLIVTAILDALLVPARFNGMPETVIFGLWIIYLSIWIRKINPNSDCLFWAVISILVQIVGWHSREVQSTVGLLMAFVIREDLLMHYNEQEPVGLRLSVPMTFFFSFLYLQYHLYDIGQAKRLRPIVPIQEPSRTLLP
jgi:hypothetical protein